MSQKRTMNVDLSYFPSVHCVQKFFLRDFINNGNRTEWSPIRSVIIQVLQNQTTAKQESDLLNHEYDYRLNWTTRSPVTN